MTRLHLHIGGPKTGTTSFQKALARDGALDNTEFWTPNLGRVRNGGHHHLLLRLLGIFEQPGQRLDPIDQLKEAARSQTGDAIISSEFGTRFLKYYDNLFQFMLGQFNEVFDEISIIQVWRNSASLISSRYQQSLCNLNHIDDFETFAERAYSEEAYLLKRTLAGYGRGRKTNQIAYRDADNKYNSIDAICARIGVKFAKTDDDVTMNKSRPLAQLAATKWLIEETGLRPRKHPKFHNQLIHNLIKETIDDLGGDKARFQGFTPEMFSENQTRNQSIREKFAALHWGQSWEEATAPKGEVPTVNLSVDYMPEDSRKLAREVVGIVKEKLPRIFATPIKRGDHAKSLDTSDAEFFRLNNEVLRPKRAARPRRELFLHVGGHKTGTTSFQALLKPPTLDLENSGLWTPHLGQGADGAHHHLIYRIIGAYSAIDGADVETALRSLSDANPRPCIISSEFCHHLMIFQPSLFRLVIRSLQRIFDEVTVIQVIRDTAPLINSHYQQVLCNFLTNDSFGDYTRTYLESQRRLLSRTLNGFGMGLEITCLPYQPHKKGFNSVDQLAEAIGLKVTSKLARVNERRSIGQMIAAKQLMDSEAVDTYGMIHAQRFRVYTAILNALADAPIGPRFQGFDSDLLAETTRTNGDLRDRFAAKIWGQSWHDTFGTPEIGPHQSLDQSTLPNDVAAAIDKTISIVVPDIPKFMYRGAVAPLGRWNMKYKDQYRQLAELNRAARKRELKETSNA